MRTWLPDASHYPGQLTPLSATVWLEAVGVGLHAAMAELRGPFAGFAARTHRGWAYEGQLAVQWEPDAERMHAAASDVGRTWTEQIRPRVHEITAALHALRPDVGDPADAQAVLDRMWALVLEQWTLHFLAVVPAQFAIEEFTDRYTARFGSRDPLAPYRVLSDAATESLLADQQLQALAAEAADRGVADLVTDFPPETVVQRLRQVHQGRLFLHSLEGYLLQYGGRSRWHELSLPREVERPDMTFQALRLLLETGRGASPGPPRDETEIERVLKRAPELRETLQSARDAYVLKESHVYHIDYPGLLATREVLLGFGRRLMAVGVLDDAEDVWFLTRPELRAVLGAEAPDAAGLQARFTQRRAELDAGAAEGALPYLGVAPDESADQHAVLEKFYGAASAAGQPLQGAGASPGVAEGTACLVRGPEDFDRVRSGAVLVTTTTTPAWTPLFGSLAALVTETGGVLCHAAIVAREYGIPAVVGLADATAIIPDGAMVRVDGTTGVIELL